VAGLREPQGPHLGARGEHVRRDPTPTPRAPADNRRETAADVMKEYFEDIGGRPEKPTKGTKRKSAPAAAATKSETGTPASTSKRSRKAAEPVEKAWSPPPGSWEHDVSHIDTVEQSLDPKTGKDAKFAYIVWNNQKKTQHPLKHIYTKCPQKVRRRFSCNTHACLLTPPDAPILRIPPRLHHKRPERRRHGRGLLARPLVLLSRLAPPSSSSPCALDPRPPVWTQTLACFGMASAPWLWLGHTCSTSILPTLIPPRRTHDYSCETARKP
jgi:hypothetical protein